MVILTCIVSYVTISIILHIAFRHACKTGFTFRMPKSKLLFYALSFTWGLPLTLFGCFVAVIMFVMDRKPKRFGWCWCFELEKSNWGMELGIFFIAPKDSLKLKYHEHGHGIQNIYIGIFTPLVVTIPSMIRFWWRNIKYSVFGIPNKTAYDDIWFEQSATESGMKFVKELEE